jgi:hypothetical protein
MDHRQTLNLSYAIDLLLPSLLLWGFIERVTFDEKARGKD